MKIIRPVTVADANLLSSNVAETDYAAYSAGATYGLGDRAIYVLADTHWIIESVQAGNIGHTPLGTDLDTWWLKVGNTNRWAMFDGAVQSQTSAADEIVVELSSAISRIDSVALFNVDCASARVRVIDAVDGVVYDQTKNMVSHSGIADWYAYSFEPIVRIRDYVFTGLPPYLGATIEVTLTDTGGTAKCGACVPGLAREIGGTQYGVQVGILDNSVKEKDAFGNFTIVERDYSKFAAFQVIVPRSMVDELQIILAGYRATPTVVVGSELYASTMIYGYYTGARTVIAYANESILSIEYEGLT
jgi:hypothetical protein